VSAAAEDVNKLTPSTMSPNGNHCSHLTQNYPRGFLYTYTYPYNADVQHYVDFIAAVEAEAKPKPARTILRKHLSDHFRRTLRLDEKPSAPLTASKVLTKEEEERLFKNVFQLARDGVFPHGHTAHPEWLEALSRMYPLYMAHMWDEVGDKIAVFFQSS
jgi:hypothetical protein